MNYLNPLPFLFLFSFETNGDSFDSDFPPDAILIGDEILPKTHSSDRNAVKKKHIWKGGIIPYVIHESLNDLIPQIMRAINEYESKTCLKFINRTTESSWVRMRYGSSCASAVGNSFGGTHPLILGFGCWNYGTILHELGHAVGFHHAHQRPDRDDHLIIYPGNITKGFDDQFRKKNYTDVQILGPFDTESIMLYGDSAFSKDNYSKTMEHKFGIPLIETYFKKGLSVEDVKMINKLYDC